MHPWHCYLLNWCHTCIVSGMLNRRKCYLWFNPNQVVTTMLNSTAKQIAWSRQHLVLSLACSLTWLSFPWTINTTLKRHYVGAMMLILKHFRDSSKVPRYFVYNSILHHIWMVPLLTYFTRCWVKRYPEPWTIGNIYFTMSVKNILIVSVVVMFSCYITDWHTILPIHHTHCTAS